MEASENEDLNVLVNSLAGQIAEKSGAIADRDVMIHRLRQQLIEKEQTIDTLSTEIEKLRSEAPDGP